MGNPAPPHPPEIDGKVLLPGDAGYDHARAAWKAINARRPAQAAQARSGDGVDITPAFALRHDYRVSIP